MWVLVRIESDGNIGFYEILLVLCVLQVCYQIYKRIGEEIGEMYAVLRHQESCF